MGGKGKEALSHEEVWDDSALIDSWNSALDEYKKYHSIHAKGGSLKDLEEAVNSSAEKMEVIEPEGATDVQAEPDSDAGQPPSTTTVPSAGMAPPGPPPQALLGSMKDENLKKLLMSWYYAGYYTGLFEGQQQAQQGGSSQ